MSMSKSTVSNKKVATNIVHRHSEMLIKSVLKRKFKFVSVNTPICKFSFKIYYPFLQLFWITTILWQFTLKRRYTFELRLIKSETRGWSIKPQNTTPTRLRIAWFIFNPMLCIYPNLTNPIITGKYVSHWVGAYTTAIIYFTSLITSNAKNRWAMLSVEGG